MIDCAYADSLEKAEKFQFFKEEFGDHQWLPDIYPDATFFDYREIKVFYTGLFNKNIQKKEFETAGKCLEVLRHILHPDKMFVFEKTLKWAKYPWKRGWDIIKIILVIIAVIAAIGWIIWGIISFFRWIF